MTPNQSAPPSIEGARSYARSFAIRAIDNLIKLADEAKSEHVRSRPCASC